MGNFIIAKKETHLNWLKNVILIGPEKITWYDYLGKNQKL